MVNVVVRISRNIFNWSITFINCWNIFVLLQDSGSKHAPQEMEQFLPGEGKVMWVLSVTDLI